MCINEPVKPIKINWSKPFKMPEMSMEIRLGLPCGAHADVFSKKGSRVERINDKPCDWCYCMYNTDEWKNSPKFLWIRARMYQLGWDGKSPYAEYFNDALRQWNRDH